MENSPADSAWSPGTNAHGGLILLTEGCAIVWLTERFAFKFRWKIFITTLTRDFDLLVSWIYFLWPGKTDKRHQHRRQNIILLLWKPTANLVYGSSQGFSRFWAFCKSRKQNRKTFGVWTVFNTIKHLLWYSRNTEGNYYQKFAPVWR